MLLRAVREFTGNRKESSAKKRFLQFFIKQASLKVRQNPTLSRLLKEMAKGGLHNSWKLSSHINGRGSRKEEVGLVCAGDGSETKDNLQKKQNEKGCPGLR